MPNMAVQYQGPNPCLRVLTTELRTRFGNPARTYEFVTGYKSASNVSGHNADNYGVVHSVDIFVGPGNLSEAQGIDTAERLRLEGTKGKIAGHPDRLAYIIHRGRIAGDHTNWLWVAYTGADWHGDHIHVSSVFDYYWGDPVPGNLDPSNYNSTAPWNLWAPAPSKPLSTAKPTPIKKDVPEVKYKRLYPTASVRRLGKGAPWFLKAEGANKKFQFNENYACLGVGHYSIDLFIQGYGLPEGESIEVQFYVVTKGKRSGYFTQKVHGTKSGEFKGSARFSMPVKGSTIEASVMSSCDTAYLKVYGAEIVQATV